MTKRIFLWTILFFCLIFCLEAIAEDLEQEKKMIKTLTSMENKDQDSPFGVIEFLNWNHPWNNYKYSKKEDLNKVVALMKKADVGFVRMDFLWDEIEPAQGKFEFAKYDYIVDLLTRNGIGILGLLNYSAPWASPTGEWNYPPQDFRLFVNYALKVIERYKDRIRYWEVWNEPDSYIYWATQDGLKSYCELLRDVYIAVKKIDPDCKILNGGLANGLASVNWLYDNGAKGYFDILNIHHFETPLNPNAIKAVIAYPKLAYKIMSRNGDAHKKIWITETGCPGVKRGLKVKNWWMGKNPTEHQQAKWVKNVFTELAKDKNVERIFWAFFRDCKEHWSNGVDYFGLIRWDFSPKPSFCAYQKSFQDWENSKKRQVNRN